MEAALLAAPTAEEEIENRVLDSAMGDNDEDMAAEEMETGTEAALPTPASSEAIGEVAEMVTEAPTWPLSPGRSEEKGRRRLLKENLRRKTLQL